MSYDITYLWLVSIHGKSSADIIWSEEHHDGLEYGPDCKLRHCSKLPSEEEAGAVKREGGGSSQEPSISMPHYISTELIPERERGRGGGREGERERGMVATIMTQYTRELNPFPQS